MTDKRTYDLTTQATLDTDAFFVIDKSGWATARRIQGSVLDAYFVEVAGDTMTGGLILALYSSTVPVLTLGDATYGVSSASNAMYFYSGSAGYVFNTAGGSPTTTIGGATAGLAVDQLSETGAKPVLLLDQADIDLEFIKFIGSSEDGVADRSLVDAADMTTPGALTGWIQVYVEDIQGTNPITDGVYYIPFYAAPSA